ncbi:MAG: Lrp/AsnC ligand binding domain-containing protein [Candidatus Bathyarchaeia archaeon]
MKAYMCLTCKVGAYNRVLEQLLKLHIPRGDIFLLFGPFDILIQFSELKSLDEFIERWFSPIVNIGGKEALISRSMTFIVINEGPAYVEEPYAFIFLNTKPRDLAKVQAALLKVPEVLSADTVFGPYDLICAVKAKDRQDLERVISYIHKNIPGIEGSMTTITAMIRI